MLYKTFLKLIETMNTERNEAIDQIQLALRHLEMNWEEINSRIENFNQSIDQQTTSKDMKKIAGEASDLLEDLDESEKLLKACLDRIDFL